MLSPSKHEGRTTNPRCALVAFGAQGFDKLRMRTRFYFRVWPLAHSK
jgi:hypothetical protein